MPVKSQASARVSGSRALRMIVVQLLQCLARVAGQPGQVGEEHLGVALGHRVGAVSRDFLHRFLQLLRAALRKQDMSAKKLAFQPPLATTRNFFQRVKFDPQLAHRLQRLDVFTGGEGGVGIGEDLRLEHVHAFDGGGVDDAGRAAAFGGEGDPVGRPGQPATEARTLDPSRRVTVIWPRARRRPAASGRRRG